MDPKPIAASTIIESPLRYALVAVRRRLRRNVPIYLVLAVAVAMPCLALTFRSLIIAQGAQFGGSQAANEFDIATQMISAIAALVGLSQIVLVLGRALAQRAGEYRLLGAIVMSSGQVWQVTLWEGVLHALIGWLAGLAVTMAAIAAMVGFLGFPSPAMVTLAAIGSAALAGCLVSVIVPGAIGYFARRGASHVSGWAL